jgi:hypothetical protein
VGSESDCMQGVVVCDKASILLPQEPGSLGVRRLPFLIDEGWGNRPSLVAFSRSGKIDLPRRSGCHGIP